MPGPKPLRYAARPSLAPHSHSQSHGGGPHMRRTLFLLPTMVAILVALAPLARALERSQVPEKYQWRLSDLYASEAAWNSAKADLEKRIPALAHFQGRLGGSAESLAIAIDARMKIDRDLAQLYVYASMLSDQDV